MKKVLFALSFIFIFSNSFALFTPEPEEKRLKQDIIEFPGLKADKLYDLTCAWLAESFGSSKDVIELKDDKNKKIIGKIVTTFNVFISHVSCNSTMTIEIKDNKVRITYLPHSVDFDKKNDPRQIYGDSELKKVHASLDEITAKYKEYILKKKDVKDSDW